MPLVWAKTFSNVIVLLQNLQAVRDLVSSSETESWGKRIGC
jgi:hypothetical protein